MADDRLIVAMDVPNAVAGLELAEALGNSVSFYKIGLTQSIAVMRLRSAAVTRLLM